MTSSHREIKRLQQKKAELLKLAALRSEVKELTIADFEHILSTRPSELQSSIRVIFAVVLESYRVPADSIFSRRRTATISLARQIICYFLRKLTSATLQEIGDLLDRDHGSVSHAAISIASRSTVDLNLREQLAAMNTAITSRLEAAVHQ